MPTDSRHWHAMIEQSNYLYMIVLSQSIHFHMLHGFKVRIDCKASADLDDHRLVSCFVGVGSMCFFSCEELIALNHLHCNRLVNLHVFSVCM